MMKKCIQYYHKYLTSILNIENARFLYFIIILYYVFHNLIFKLLSSSIDRDTFLKSIIPCFPFALMFALSMSLFMIFYVIGKQLKKICGFQYISTGVVAFFAITFFYNITLAVLKISCVKYELVGLIFFILFLVAMGVVEIKTVKRRIFFVLSFFIVFALVLKIARIVTITRYPFELNPFSDEVGFWHPTVVSYFNNGLLFTIRETYRTGYGLFAQHVFVTMERLLFFNIPASFYLPPKLLILLVIGFIIEIRTKKIAIYFTVLLFILTMYHEVWLRFLLLSSLYREGVVALFFAIILREILEKQYLSSENNRIYKNVALFAIIGSLYLFKPDTVSYMCFLLPFIYLGYHCEKQKYFARFLSVFLPMFIFPSLLLLVHIRNDLTLSHTIISFSKIDLRVVFPILEHWKRHMWAMRYYIISILGGLLGITAYNKDKIMPSLFIVFLNLFMIYIFYATVYANAERESAFRYFSKTYYVCLYIFSLGFAEVFNSANKFLRSINSRIIKYFKGSQYEYKKIICSG